MLATPDKYQQKVIQSAAKDVLVLAGAGSGKTFTLLSKISYLASKGVDPSSILVLTFTRVAAESMKSKYLSRFSDIDSKCPEFHTFHGFCYKLLKDFKEVRSKLGYDEVPRVLSEEELRPIFAEAKSLSSCKLSDRKLRMASSLKGKDKRQAENFFRELKRILKRSNCIDFDSLSEDVCGLVMAKDESVIPVVEKYRYLFVDEFQDTDEVQYRFVQAMDHCRRILCGDALQNIYQFRGCSNEPLKQLVQDESWVKFELPVNYRSSYRICSYVNSLSRKFKSSSYRIELKSDVPGPKVRTVRSNDDKYDNLAYLSSFYLKQGSVAVLCRSNFEVAKTVKELESSGLSCSSPTEKDYSASVVEAAMDDKAMEAFLLFHSSDQDYFRIQALMDEGNSFEESVERLMPDCSFSEAYRDVQMVKSACQLSEEEASFSLCFMFEVNVPSNPMNGVELLHYLLNRVKSKKESTLYVGTIHSVKGLEFDSVAVMGVGSNSFKIDSEETENLLYTACTRAKRNLAVFYES